MNANLKWIANKETKLICSKCGHTFTGKVGMATYPLCPDCYAKTYKK